MISKRPGPAPYLVVADFLRARVWAGSCIATASQGNRAPAYPSEIGDATLDDLLKYERCAAWLLDALTANGNINALAASTVEIIRTAAMNEIQSAMHARLDARELSSIAERLGIPMIVLKGGVRAIATTAPALPLVDIDILVKSDKVDAVVAELVNAGFGTARQKLSHHQGLDPANDHLSVEVHWSLLGDGAPVGSGIWDRKLPIANAPGLFSQGKTDNLVHVARHALENHREKHVSLRDTILAGVIAESCSADELMAARNELRKRDRSGEALEMISFGLQLIGKSNTATNDPFIEKCAAFYATVAIAPQLPKVAASAGALAFVGNVAIGRAGFISAARDSMRWKGTSVKMISKSEKTFPVLVRPLAGLAHLVYYAVVSAIALPRVRDTKAKALSEFNRRTV